MKTKTVYRVRLPAPYNWQSSHKTLEEAIAHAKEDPFFKDNVTESVKHAWYKGGKGALHPYKGETLPHIGDLVFTSEARPFSSQELVDFHTTSRTYSVYYPDTRPGSDRYTVVVSLNARYADWKNLSDEEYEKHKARLIEESIVALEKHVPGVRARIDWTEAATPRTIERYTTHAGGTSFGTKFEGLKVSMDLPQQMPGLYHAGSVGIIMSGWLGTINYGVIVANKIGQQVGHLLGLCCQLLDQVHDCLQQIDVFLRLALQ